MILNFDRTYVAGQLSDLLRKSIEPIALEAGTPPRTLQRFLESMEWDEMRLRDRLQGIVVRDHAHGHAIGTIDESGYPKKGCNTAAGQKATGPVPCRYFAGVSETATLTFPICLAAVWRLAYRLHRRATRQFL